MQDDTQQMVYFTHMEGTLAEEVNVPKKNVVRLPQGSDPIQVAAMMNPAAAAWMPLAGPAVKEHLPKDFTVLILGATSASGRLAISFAKSLGAKRIVGVARNEEKLNDIAELDEVIVMQADPQKTDFSSLGNVDVIVDYVYGPLVEHLLESLDCTSMSGCTYVNVGGLSGAKNISLSSDVLRCKRLRLMGAGKGSWSMEEWNAEIPKVLEALQKISTVNKHETITVKHLEDVQEEWNATTGDGRLVFEMYSKRAGKEEGEFSEAREEL
jgi:NADPH:quinone reductase-like Zn-dependent oxidoreductase